MTLTNLKIHDSKGRLYVVCPFIKKIQYIIFVAIEEKRSLEKTEFYEICRHLEAIEEIARFWEQENPCGEINYEAIYKPYNFTAVIKNIKHMAKYGDLTPEKIDEIVNLYM